MRVICDDEAAGICTSALIIDWGLRETCQLEGCDQPSRAIVCLTADETPTGEPLRFTLCKDHHDKARAEDKFEGTVVW